MRRYHVVVAAAATVVDRVCSFWGLDRHARSFCATVCETVCPVISDHYLSVLSVTVVYCGQTVGWIKMKLCTKVGLDPGHIVLDGDPTPPPQRGTAPQFSAHVCCGQAA